MNMDMVQLAKGFVFSFGAVYFFSVVFCAPRRTQLACGLIGALCRTLFSTMQMAELSPMLCYFVPTLLLALLCETGAVIFKSPATVFLSTSVLGMVPGLALYRTMRLLTSGSLNEGAQIGIATLLEIAIMAMAIALGLFLVRMIRKGYRRVCQAIGVKQ